MSLVPYTITALERDNADAVSSGKQVIVGASCSMFIQPANTVVQLFDNAAGANGSTAKTTGANGQVTVYIDPGEYRVSVNGTDSFKIVGRDDTDFGTGATATVTVSTTDITGGRLFRQGDTLSTIGVFLGVTSDIGGLGANVNIDSGSARGIVQRSAANVRLQEYIVGGSTVGFISTDGTSTSFSTSSDRRLKETITNSESASDDIDAIQIRQFVWSATGKHQKYGVITQELAVVAPDSVSVSSDEEEMQGADLSKLVPMIIKEVQELRARVAQLEI